MATLAPLGPSPFDADHHVLVQRLSSIHDQIGALTAESVLVQSEIEALVTKKVDWEREERARLQREEEERLERERREREERERLERERVERERVERVERERKEKEERERIERERAEREEKERLERLERERVEQERLARVEAERMAALETEKAARQAEKERLEREWAEKERLEEEAREEAERKEEEKRQREAALAAASAGAIAAQSTSAESGPRELNLRCQALYDLDGDENNDELSFSTGDLFTVSGEMNGWMSARQERTGKVGLVPSNYLKVLEVLEPQAQPQAAGVQSAGSGVHSNGVGGTAAVPAAAVASAEKEKKGESVVALFDFVGENDDELSFTTGQRLLKTGEVNGWYIGTLEGQTKVGIFPSNFVELVEDVGVAADSAVPVNEEPAPVSTPVAITATTYASADPSNDRHRVLPSGLASSGASATMTPAPSVQRTKSTAFAAAEVASLAQMANDTAAPATPRSSMGASTPSSSAAGNSAPVDGVEPDAVALFKFTATSHDQLSFDKGAKLAIKATLNGWYVGQEIGKPALGIFPANYVQKREKDDKGAALGNGGSQAGLAKSEEARKEQAAVAVAGAGAGALVADDGAEPSWRYNKAKVAESPAFSSAGTPLTPSSPSNAPKVIGHVTALYDYHSTTPENLSFSKGDVIPVVKEIKGWWAGLLDGKLGLVPSNYCTPFRPVDGAGNDSAAPVATVGMAGAALMSSQAAHAPVSSFAASSASTNGTAGAKYPVVSSGGLPAHVQPFAVLAPTTSSSSVSVAPSAVSVASSQPQKASEVSAPPPLSAKPQLLSSLAMSNAGSGQPNNAGAYPVVGTANSAANASLTPVVAPASTGPSRLSGSTTAQPSTQPSEASAPVVLKPAVLAPVAAVPSAAPSTVVSSSSATSSSMPSTSTSSSVPVAAAAPPLQKGERLCVALHDWDTSERGELRFRKDERLVITKEKAGWYSGYVQGDPGRKGFFPSMAVQVMSPEQLAAASAPAPPPPSAAIAPSIAVTATSTPSVSRPTTPVSSTRAISRSSAASGSPSTSAADVLSLPPVMAELERGVAVTKLDSRGRGAKQVRLYLERERLSRNRRGEWIVRWDTKKLNSREAQMTLSKCRVKRGLNRAEPFQGRGCPFTLLSAKRDLEIITNSEQEREAWIEALQALNVPLEGAAVDGAVIKSVPEEEVLSMSDMLKNGPPADMQKTPVVLSSAAPAAAPTVVSAKAHSAPAMAAVPPSIAPVSAAVPAPAAAAQLSMVPAGRLVTALFDFGTEVDDLVITTGDRIEVTDAQKGSEWWSGRNLTKGGAKVGMFPASYVSVDSLPAQPQSVTQVPSNPPLAAAAAPTLSAVVSPAPAPVAVASSAVMAGGARAKALFDFETDTTQFPDDLPFKQGDVLTLIDYRKDSEWWTGQDARGRKGTFPATFVKVM